jgi:hypothetical protein
MIDESLLKSNFIGRDGFRWWIGQIPPIANQSTQANGGGWGVRYKVRIMGYHPANEQELSNDDLPWAQVLIPPTAGTGGANRSSSVMLTQGDVVFGFFLDGDNAQIPVIMGSFGKTSAVSTKDYSQPFVPFTGYTNRIPKPPKSVLPQGEAGDQNAESQKSPRHTSPAQATGIGPNDVSYSGVIGSITRPANASAGSTIGKINTEINNLLGFVQNISTIIPEGSSYLQSVISFEVKRVTQKIQDVVSGLVNGMVNQLFKALAPLINQGLKLLYELVYNLVLAATQNPVIAHLAGVAAQTAMVSPVKALADLIPSIANTIIGGLGGLISSILTSVVGNVSNFVSCAANQFTGVLTNSIIGQVSGGLSSAIGAIGPITQFFGGFSVENTMRSSSEILGGFGQIVNTGQSATNFDAPANEWVIGRGPKSSRTPNFADILRTANDAYALATSAISGVNAVADLAGGFSNFAASSASPRGIDGCYSGPPLSCGAPVINIFGSNGSGASAIPILGGIVGDGRSRTGSVIGVKLTNPGSGYDFPPFVEIVDNCNQGYGAIARAVLNDSGQIDYIYIVSEGENYPVGDLEEYVITDIRVVDPGNGYVNGDVIVDNFGNQYSAQVLNGAILKVDPLNIITTTELPILTVISAEGSGAILSPILDTRAEYQGEVKQVIDCITK